MEDRPRERERSGQRTQLAVCAGPGEPAGPRHRGRSGSGSPRGPPAHTRFGIQRGNKVSGTATRVPADTPASYLRWPTLPPTAAPGEARAALVRCHRDTPAAPAGLCVRRLEPAVRLGTGAGAAPPRGSRADRRPRRFRSPRALASAAAAASLSASAARRARA